MKVENMGGYWQASGDGPIRPIVTEGSSQKQARMRWTGIWRYQKDEAMKAEAAAERRAFNRKQETRDDHI